MIRIFHIHFPAILLVLAALDAAILYVAIDLSLEVSRLGFAGFAGDLANVTLRKTIFVLAMISALFSMGVYAEEAMAQPRELVARVAVSLFLAFITLVLVFYVFPSTRIWLSAMIPATLAAPLCLWLARKLLRRASRAIIFKPRIIVLGAGEKARQVEALERSSPNRFICAGFLPLGEEPTVDRRRVIREVDVRRICGILRPHEIVVAFDDRRNALPTEALISCRLAGTRVTPLEAFLERETGRIEIEHLDPRWLVFSDGTTRGMIWRAAKRLFDVCVSGALLLMTIPLLALAAAAIWAEDRGPIFYAQERVGLHGRGFRMLKFRTMRVDAERDGVARWAAKKDPRVTCVGAFLRRSRFDEFPQLMNVLKGEMSFVGPRPERPPIVADIAREVPYYDCRHLVKPGITGWAQICHGYTDSLAGALEKLKYDLYYIKNGGILFDTIIIMQSVHVVLWGRGAR